MWWFTWLYVLLKKINSRKCSIGKEDKRLSKRIHYVKIEGIPDIELRVADTIPNFDM